MPPIRYKVQMFLMHPINQAAGMLSFFKRSREATSQQKNYFRLFDPLQMHIDEKVQSLVEHLFNTYVKDTPRYVEKKQTLCTRYFSSTQDVLDKTKKFESSLTSLERCFDLLEAQPALLVRIEKICLTVLFFVILPQWISHPARFVMLVGTGFTLWYNHLAFKILLQDMQRCVHILYALQSQPLKARMKIREITDQVVDRAYPDVDNQPSTHRFHLANVTRWFSEKILGSRADFDQGLHGQVETRVFAPIRTFEREQRFEVFSRISDLFCKKLTVILFSQGFRMLMTNLTGLGIVALIYWLTHYFIDTPSDLCEWATPLHYIWNRVFPLNLFHTFPEECHRYVYLLWASDTAKWALRFYVWNTIIKQWQATHEQALEDLVQPFKQWSQRKWTILTTTLSHTVEMAKDKILSVLTGEQNGEQVTSPFERRAHLYHYEYRVPNLRQGQDRA